MTNETEVLLTKQQIEELGIRLLDVYEILENKGKTYGIVLEELNTISTILMSADDELNLTDLGYHF